MLNIAFTITAGQLTRRFGVELVEYIASLYNCDIEIIDSTEKSEQQELVEDLVQIIIVFNLIK